MQFKLRNPSTDRLFQAISSLQTPEECYQFFEDICTVNEILSFSQRFEVARMLRENKVYTEISRETGASTATISRVKRALNYGSDGYDLALTRLKKQKKSKNTKKNAPKS